MPVKFRCSQCSQLLGISKRKIGASVTCPKCHHPVVVPPTDMVATVAGSKVSRIFEQSDFDKLIAKRTTSSGMISAGGDVASERLESVALLEEVELHEFPAPPGRKTLSPNGPSPDRLGSKANDRVVPVAGDSSGATPESTSDSSALLQAKPAFAKASAADAQRNLADDSRLSVEWLALAGIVVAFVSGLAIGRYVIPVTVAAGRTENKSEPDAAMKAVDPALPVEKKLQVHSAATLRGMLRAKIDGELKPDAGAIALIFPVEKSPEVKPSPEALRPNGVDDGESMNRLRQAGAAHAVADANGLVASADLNPGDYWVLYISNNQRRDLSQPVPADERSAIAQFFGQVDALLKDRAFLLVRRKLAPGEESQLNHTFLPN